MQLAAPADRGWRVTVLDVDRTDTDVVPKVRPRRRPFRATHGFSVQKKLAPLQDGCSPSRVLKAIGPAIPD